MRENDTIAAISTAMLPAAISVIRLSGETSLLIADKLFKGRKSLENCKGYEAIYGKLFTLDGKNMLDEVIATLFLAPHSYTGENMVEISCHGGVKLTETILAEILLAGARMAEPGEFTKRAFLNGKLDLLKADAVADLIYAKTDLAAKVAAKALEGKTGGKIKELRERILFVLGNIQAFVDFPEEEIEEVSKENLEAELKTIRNEISTLVSSFHMGRIIKEGIKTAIVGKPNAGKSTLMNLLSGEEKSIVTMTPGTTRDVITETIEVDGILLNIADTAGIRESGDEIEKIGIARALERLMDSDLVIAVFDTSIPLDENDYAVLEKIHGKNVVGVINKCDLENKLETELILREIPDAIFISAIDDGGIKDLKKLIKKKTTGDFDYQNDDVITSLRQKEKLFRAMECVDNALNSIYDGFTPDITGIDLEDAVRAFGELTGETVGEQVVDSIFHRFCLGK